MVLCWQSTFLLPIPSIQQHLVLHESHKIIIFCYQNGKFCPKAIIIIYFYCNTFKYKNLMIINIESNGDYKIIVIMK